MTIVVTGSTGRIGGRLVDALLARGLAVRGFDQRASGKKHTAFSEAIGTLDDPAVAREACKGATAVFHLGAAMSWVAADQGKMFRANVEGTRVVLEATLQAGVGRFVFASSGEVYPENKPEFLPVDEGHPLKPQSAYGLTKLLGEEMVHWAGRSAGLQTTILRFSHTQDAAELLDPESFFSGPRFFLQARIRQQVNFGNMAAVAALQAVDDGTPALVLARNQHGRPYRMHITDTRDMVAGMLAAFDSEATVGGTFNLGATDTVDFATALPAMARITGLPVKAVDLPGDGVFYETSNRRLREATGFSPTYPFDRMLEEAATAWRAKHRS